jgi:FtsP/CotA-like multicopper oxidase with cupredoxin domain
MHREEKDSKRTRVMSRRRFVQGMAAGAGFAAYQWIGRPTLGETVPFKPAVLTGTHFELTIDSIPVNFTGRPSRATAVNGSTPGPVLRWREGDTITISLANRLKHTTSIHWHGVRVPADMDGVPGLSFAGIPPRQDWVRSQS